jgi:phosphoribosylaminoimidazole-succinocarboxamide synthase
MPCGSALQFSVLCTRLVLEAGNGQRGTSLHGATQQSWHAATRRRTAIFRSAIARAMHSRCRTADTDLERSRRQITPSTKGILKGIPGVPEQDDVNITRQNIVENLEAFNFKKPEDVDTYERLLKEGFNVISEALQGMDQIFVDTKFEFGWVTDKAGNEKLIYMDEVGTPDSSRIWDGAAYKEGKVVENSKEGFRQTLLTHFPDPDVFTNKDRMPERAELAKTLLPKQYLMDVSKTYTEIAEKITGAPVPMSENPKDEIIAILRDQYGIIKA